jgi:cytochrome b
LTHRKERQGAVTASGTSYPIWDLPTRVFHWLLVLGIGLAWMSHEFEWIDVHRWNGYVVLVLVSFRILWGFFGSIHSRFADFLRPPSVVLRYWRGQECETVGHNPPGGWSILVMLALVLVQALTGLFNSDGLMFDGPLYHALDHRVADLLGEVHDQLFWIILGFVGLHIAAIAWYRWVRGKALVTAMVTGGSAGERAPAPVTRAIFLLALCAGTLALAIYLAPEPVLPW